MRLKFVLNILAFVSLLVVNYLATALPLNGKNTGELSNLYPNVFTPAGLTFSIWGVIYLWLLLWVGYQVGALFSKKMRDRIESVVQKSGYWFAATCVLNMAWLFAWHWQQVALSVAIMVALLVALWRLNRSAEVGFFQKDNLGKWLAHAPFGLYQGWITIALIANVTALLVSMGWDGAGLSEANWAVIMILVGTLLTTTIVRHFNNVFHGLAVAWALFGIFLKQRAAGDPGVLPVSTVALAGMALILFWVVYRWQRWHAY